MKAVPNVSSALTCGQLCGTYTYTHEGVSIPCAAWSWVEKSWAKEFGGFKSCAMFGFIQNDAGIIRFPVSEYTFKNHCCTAGTPCKTSESLTGYSVSTDRVAAAYRKAERGRRGREKKERIAAARAAKIEAAAEAAAAKIEAAKPFSDRSMKYKGLTIIAAVLGLGVIAGVCAWLAGYGKQ